jgi:hypothetical protein
MMQLTKFGRALDGSELREAHRASIEEIERKIRAHEIGEIHVELESDFLGHSEGQRKDRGAVERDGVALGDSRNKGAHGARSARGPHEGRDGAAGVVDESHQRIFEVEDQAGVGGGRNLNGADERGVGLELRQLDGLRQRDRDVPRLQEGALHLELEGENGDAEGRVIVDGEADPRLVASADYRAGIFAATRYYERK